MPVNIPRLQRIQPTTEGAINERISGRAQDQGQSILNQTQAVTGLVKQGIDIHTGFENEKIKTLSYEAENEYALWQEKRLQEVKSLEGDPTKAYATLAKEEQEFAKSLLDKHEGVSERVKRSLAGNLEKVRDSANLSTLKQRGFQTEVYKNNLFNDTIKTRRKRAIESASYIEAGKKSSLFAFENDLGTIKEAVMERALEKGLGEEVLDKDGNRASVKLSNAGELLLAKEVSSTVSDSVTHLLDNKQPREARELFKQYENRIDPLAASKLEKKFKKADLNDIAFSTYRQIENKAVKKIQKEGREASEGLQPGDEKNRIATKFENMLEEIEKIKNPEVRNRVRKIKLEEERSRLALVKMKEDRSYEVVMDEVSKMKKEGTLYSELSVEENPRIAKLLGSMSDKQKRTVLEQIESPKKTDPDALSGVMDVYLGNVEGKSFTSMKPVELEELIQGLDEPDKRSWRNRYTKVNEVKDSKSLINFNKYAKLLEDNMFVKEIIKPDKHGKLSRSDKNTLRAARLNFIDYLDGVDLTSNSTPKEVNDHINKFISDKKLNKLFNGASGGGFFENLFTALSGDDETSIPKKKRTGNPLKGLNTTQIRDLRIQYKRTKKLRLPAPIDDPGFLSFVESKS